MSPPLARLIGDRRYWLFDLDGTLIDSAPAHEAAFRAALAQFAPDRLAQFRYAEHAGATTAEVFARLGIAEDLIERLTARKQELYRSYLDDGRVALLPGAVRLLDLLRALGRSSYLVTSGSRASVAAVLARGPLSGRFDGVLTGDDLPRGKPDPAVYREAMRRWRLDPGEAVVVEDSANGVASATGAGLLVLRVHGSGPLTSGPLTSGPLTSGPLTSGLRMSGPLGSVRVVDPRRSGPVVDLHTLPAIVSLLDLVVPVAD